MFSQIRRRVSYVNVLATLALVFAMSGGALAASKYLITSTKQISPKVLKSLKGAKGKNGAAGPQGAIGSAGTQGAIGSAGTQGATGPAGTQGAKGENGTAGKEGKEGKEGPPGPFVDTLPSGKSEKGQWADAENVSGAAELLIYAISFPIPLASHPTVHFIGEGAATPSGCLGSVAEPAAEPGNLCVFAQNMIGVKFDIFLDVETNSVEAAGRTGTELALESTESGSAQGLGTWAVTEA